MRIAILCTALVTALAVSGCDPEMLVDKGNVEWKFDYVNDGGDLFAKGWIRSKVRMGFKEVVLGFKYMRNGQEIPDPPWMTEWKFKDVPPVEAITVNHRLGPYADFDGVTVEVREISVW
jgi:hypothetical protein